MRDRLRLFGAALWVLAVAALGGAPAHAQTMISATVVLQEGDTPSGGDGTAVTVLDNPFTTSSGKIGFGGRVASGDHFLWFNGNVVWLGARALAPYTLSVLSSSTGWMGFSDAGNFFYTPEIDNGTGVRTGLWSDGGYFLREYDPALGFDLVTYPAAIHLFLYNPRMSDVGAATWVSSIDIDANGSSDRRALYISPDGSPASATVLLESGDVVPDTGGVMIPIASTGSGLDFDYSISNDGLHYGIVAILDTGTTVTDSAVIVDGVVVAQEGVTSDGATGFLDFFDLVAVNNAGDHLISGDGDGPTGTDEYIAYNGVVMVREGDSLGGITLSSSAFVQGIDINNLGAVVHHWTFAGGEAIFYAPSGATMGLSSVPVMRAGDSVDLDGDRIPDATITDLNGTTSGGPSLNLADDGRIVVYVDLDYDGDGTGETEAILSFEPAFCGDGVVNGGEQCDEGGVESATCDLDCSLPRCGDGLVNAMAGEDCDEAGRETATCDLDCTLVFCGDGTHNGAAGEECDDGGESATCDLDCTPAVCGDLNVNPTAGEDCDVGGEVTAFCDPNCTAPICGDGYQNALAGEFCDEAGETADCDLDCSPVYCGDGRVNMAAGEACDEIGEGLECDYDCTAVECGDGILNRTAGEECDSAEESASCNADCTLARCGDSVVNAAAGEGCDTGGPSATCDADCTAATCGDGFVNAAAGEDCDTSGPTATCDADCSAVVCGDGVTNVAAGEECDAGGDRSAVCDMDCTVPLCGDGVLNPAAGEECEDGNMENNDGCSAECLFETLGGTSGGACGCHLVGAPEGQGRGGLAILALLGALGLGLRLRRRR